MPPLRYRHFQKSSGSWSAIVSIATVATIANPIKRNSARLTAAPTVQCSLRRHDPLHGSFADLPMGRPPPTQTYIATAIATMANPIANPKMIVSARFNLTAARLDASVVSPATNRSASAACAFDQAGADSEHQASEPHQPGRVHR